MAPRDGVLQREHPKFVGNAEDLDAFLRLAASPIRSEQRARALEEWSAYKSSRQRAFAVRQGVAVRKKGGSIRALTLPAIDLRGANLDELCVGYADLRGVRFDGASMRRFWAKGALLDRASFRDADLTGDARMLKADLTRADFTGAKLGGANLAYAYMLDSILDGADLTGADLEGAVLVGAKLRRTCLVDARVYGTSTWDVTVEGDPNLRRNLVITEPGQPKVVVDDLEVAQFIYVLLRSPNVRKVIDTISSKGVLILGRFTPDRKAILDAIREGVRDHGLVPLLFDFERPAGRTFTETIVTLAGLSRFVIVDLTKPSSSPLELQAVVPQFKIPVVPILAEGEKWFSMYGDLVSAHGEEWGGHVMQLLRYPSLEVLLANLREKIIEPALRLAEQLDERKGGPIKSVLLS